MESIRKQLIHGIAQVSSAKVTFKVKGRTVTMNRGTLLEPTQCMQFLKHEGFSDETVAEFIGMVYDDGDLASLLREHDPNGSPVKKAAARLPRLIQAAGAIA